VVVTGDVIRAAGAVVARRGSNGVEILLVHRPKYDDWSFPKGKCLPDETDEACAVREIAEETSLRVELGDELPSTSYVSRAGPKRVRYWLVDADGAKSPRADNEVDELAWLRPGDAADRLSYPRDLEVLRGALAKLA
jgi:8-oxo-dGTP pyrophosphatase MutT (NUDIX family)